MTKKVGTRWKEIHGQLIILKNLLHNLKTLAPEMTPTQFLFSIVRTLGKEIQICLPF